MKRTHICSLLLALLMGLSLCAAPFPALADAPTGGYIERELRIPDDYVSATPPTATLEGGMALAARHKDSGEWALLTWADLSAEPTVTPLQTQDLGQIASIRFAPDGLLLAVFSNLPGPISGGQGAGQRRIGGPELKEGGDANDAGPKTEEGPRMFTSNMDDAQTQMAWFDAQGSLVSSLQVQGMVLGAAALSGQRAAALSMGAGVSIYDAQGKEISNIPKSGVYGIASTADTLLLLADGNLVEVAPDSGKELRSVPVSVGNANSIAVAGDGTVYAASASGIEKLAPGASEFSRVSETVAYMIGDPSNMINGVCALGDGSLAVLLNGSGAGVQMTSSGGRTTSSVRIGPDENEDSGQLMGYVFDPDLDMDNLRDFTVTALRANAKLRKAVSEFQRLHPDLNVKLNAPLAEDDFESPVEDHIRTLNTDLLAGKGGDVLVLDELPLSKYIEKGVLMDLTDALGDMGVWPGIYEGSKAKDGRLYALPAQFDFDTLWGDQANIDALSDLTSLLAVPLEGGQTPMFGRSPEEWLRLFYPASEAAFRDEAGKLNFDTPAFAQFLEVLYQLYSGQLEQPDESTGRGRIDMEQLQALMNQSVAWINGEIAGMMQVPIYFTAAGKQDSGVALVPSVAGTGAAYTPSLLMGINSQTQNQDLALEFIRLLFSDELQKLDQMEGLPTVRASLEALVNESKALNQNKNIRQMMMLSDGGSPLEIEQPDDAHWDLLLSLCEQLRVPAPVDETLMGFIVEETASFFEGAGSAEDAARAVMQRAMAYLNE